eukprot:364802-Chlamydomonas_euryale.AAC.6
MPTRCGMPTRCAVRDACMAACGAVRGRHCRNTHAAAVRAPCATHATRALPPTFPAACASASPSRMGRTRLGGHATPPCARRAAWAAMPTFPAACARCALTDCGRCTRESMPGRQPQRSTQEPCQVLQATEPPASHFRPSCRRLWAEDGALWRE